MCGVPATLPWPGLDGPSLCFASPRPLRVSLPGPSLGGVAFLPCFLFSCVSACFFVLFFIGGGASLWPRLALDSWAQAILLLLSSWGRGRLPRDCSAGFLTPSRPPWWRHLGERTVQQEQPLWHPPEEDSVWKTAGVKSWR